QTRLMQDVGLDGRNSEAERHFLRQGNNAFLDAIENMYAQGQLSEEAYRTFINDPAGDDFRYFRGADLARMRVSILDRYKYYNNPEGNSKPSEYSGESFSTAGTNIPDGEDINRDNTLSESESYFQYQIRIEPGQMQIGNNYISDVVTNTVKLEN